MFKIEIGNHNPVPQKQERNTSPCYVVSVIVYVIGYHGDPSIFGIPCLFFKFEEKIARHLVWISPGIN